MAGNFAALVAAANPGPRGLFEQCVEPVGIGAFELIDGNAGRRFRDGRLLLVDESVQRFSEF